MVRPVPTPAMTAAFAAYPPPYRLTANLTWLPATGEAGAVGEALQRKVTAVRGRALVAVLAAGYTAIHYGPSGRLALHPSGVPYRYRELGWLGINPRGLRQQVRFGQLWVDAPTSLPIDLGDAYGFPKLRSPVAIDSSAAAACPGGAPAIDVAWRKVCPLPSLLVRLTPAGALSFAASDLTATIGVVSARHAALVRVTQWQSALAGLDLQPMGWGVALQDAVIHLGAPA